MISKPRTWNEFMVLLDETDLNHIINLVYRLAKFSKKYDLDFAVVTVGSIIRQPYEQCGDLDLLLVPLHKEDIERADQLFRHFALSCPRNIYPDGGGLTFNEYGITGEIHGWTLIFDEGRHIQRFIKTDPMKILEEVKKTEFPYEQPFIRLFNKYPV